VPILSCDLALPSTWPFEPPGTSSHSKQNELKGLASWENPPLPTFDAGGFTLLRARGQGSDLRMSVFCPCREQRADGVPALLSRPECLFAPDELLFCAACRAVRCPFCTAREPLAWFCARCQAETTKSGARAASNTCTRACVRCPQCAADLVAADKDGWEASCPRCAYVWTHPRSERSLAEECRRARTAQFGQLDTWARDRLAGKEARVDTTQVEGSPARTAAGPAEGPAEATLKPPLGVPLRARYVKSCRQCGGVLAEPGKAAALARPVLPQLEIHGKRLLVRNFGPREVAVKLAPLDAVVTHVELAVPPLKPVENVAQTGFPAPLFLVERETVASRQAFMAGHAARSSGPGWHCVDIDYSSTPVVLFASVKTDGKEPLGAWYSVDPISASTSASN